MRFKQSISTDKIPIYIMANPDIPRIRERVAKITSGLDKLEICRFWITELDEIIIIIITPTHMNEFEYTSPQISSP